MAAMTRRPTCASGAAMSRVESAGYPAVMQRCTTELDEESGIAVSCISFDFSTEALRPVAARIQQRQHLADQDEDLVWIETAAPLGPASGWAGIANRRRLRSPLNDLKPPLEKGHAWAHEGAALW